MKYSSPNDEKWPSTSGQGRRETDRSKYQFRSHSALEPVSSWTHPAGLRLARSGRRPRLGAKSRPNSIASSSSRLPLQPADERRVYCRDTVSLSPVTLCLRPQALLLCRRLHDPRRSLSLALTPLATTSASVSKSLRQSRKAGGAFDWKSINLLPIFSTFSTLPLFLQRAGLELQTS